MVSNTVCFSILLFVLLELKQAIVFFSNRRLHLHTTQEFMGWCNASGFVEQTRVTLIAGNDDVLSKYKFGICW